MRLMSRPLIKSIDLDSLVSNCAYMKKVCKDSRLMVVVKSDAYGHGLLQVSKALTEADGFAVACISEAIALRRAGIAQKILVLQGCSAESEADSAREYGLSVVCHHQAQLEWLKRSKGEGAEVWIKFDTGMHRLGFMPQSHAQVMAGVAQLSKLPSPPVLMSHFACADDWDEPYMRCQIDTFNKIISHYKEQEFLISLANSAAALKDPQLHGDWVRSGIAVYGCPPTGTDTEHGDHLSAVMSLTAPVIATKDLKQGSRIGYGGEYVCDKATRIGILAAGYGDGYLRRAQSGAPVWINGSRYPLVGRVSMDMAEVDLGDSDVRIGDIAELWGKNLPVSQVAAHCDTIPYELLCGVSGTSASWGADT